MCGFVGLCKKDKILNDEISKISNISLNLKHRGPNQTGEWVSDNIFFSHRRLSINDLSEEGKQPMTSSSGRYIIIYNGEIYNFLELKKNLQESGIKFKSKSDTEVILSLIEEEGFLNSLKKLNGMFSFALYDKKLKKIFLARDHTGQKPLYFFKNNDTFFFTSELRNIQNLRIKTEISKEAINLFFKLSYIPAPFTIYENIFKLEKGKFLEFNLSNFKEQIKSFQRNINEFDIHNKSISKKINIFEELFSNVIQDHLISDVSTGTLLSGGIDSTLVTYFANNSSSKKINSYCVKSNYSKFDESKYAEKIAKKIGTNHETLEFSKNEFKDAIYNIHNVYDEPFGDSSQIPTYLLFKKIKDNIQVALSGDGGDEVFYGYNRYVFLNDYFDKLKTLNLFSRNLISKTLNFFSEKNYNLLNNIFNLGFFNFGNKISKISNSLKFKDLEDFYIRIVRQDYNIDNITNSNTNFDDFYKNKIKFSKINSNLKNFQQADINTYLTDDIFVKVDRSSMFFSIESRAPFVDNRIIDFSNQLDDSDKIKKNNAKYFLKKILEQHFSISDFRRPKMGFGNPIGYLLNNELKSWAEENINNKDQSLEKYVNIDKIRDVWYLHKTNKKDYSNIIWNFLILNNWIKDNEIHKSAT